MRESLVLFVFVLLESVALAQTNAPDGSFETKASEALAKARAGNTEEALEIYRGLVSAHPTDVVLLRDYVVVLGWAEKYQDAFPVIKKVRQLEKDQPDWALQEFAKIYLYGDSLLDALKTLDELMSRGDGTEQTLLRRAQTLRWLDRTEEAQSAYKTAIARYPASAEGLAGLAYSLADAGALSEAIDTLDSSRNVSPRAPEVLKAKVRILNWMGRHFEAQRLIASLPENLRDDRQILEDRIDAARWGGNPNGAMQNLNRLVTLFPNETNRKMSRELRTDYGHSISPIFRFSKDNDGLVDRSLGNGAIIHLAPAHALHVGYEYRWLEQEQGSRTLVRYEVGWNGNFNQRVSFNSTLSGVDYRTAGLERKVTGDGSLEVALNDKIRIAGGGGVVAVDAYQAIPKQLTAPFAFGNIVFSPNSSTRFQANYSRHEFSNEVVRNRAGVDFMRLLAVESSVKFKAGWRSNVMLHDEQTRDFFSPTTFQSHLAVAQGYGRITSWLEYWGEIATGWQLEPDRPALHPLQINASLTWNPSRHWRTVLDLGRSTSSLDRVLPGEQAYSRWYAGARMEFRFP